MDRLTWMNDQQWETPNTIGLSFPVKEENGRIRMVNLTTGEYMNLSQESANAYRQIKKSREKQKLFDSPKEVYKRKRRNDRFWEEYAIVFRENALIESLKESRDPRLETMLNVRNGARDLFRMNHPNTGYRSPRVQIAGANAILAYIETEHLDLYQYVQSVCKWLEDSK